MMYYLYKNQSGGVIGFNQSRTPLPPPAIPVTKEEFIRLGYYVEPETPPPTVEELQLENRLLKAQLQAQTERSDFIEDCIAEMATMVYGGV